MHKLYFVEAMSAATHTLSSKTYPSAACTAAREAFIENMSRSIGLLTIPGFVGLAATSLERGRNRAGCEIFGNRQPAQGTPEEQARFIDLATHYFNEEMQAQVPEGSQLQLISFLSDLVEQMAEGYGPTMHGSVEGILKSVIIQSWMSYEVLAADLWEGVLNERPVHLAGLRGKRNRKEREAGPKEESKSSAPKPSEDKAIPLSYLVRHNYDLSKRMGSVLRAEKCDFATLAGAREAYYSAFADGHTEIDSAINDVSLDAISAVRHVLVHRGARVDEEFKKRAKSLDQLKAFRGLIEGDSVLIDGKTIVTLVPPLYDAGRKLIEAVSTWLDAHPSKNE